MMGEPTSVDPEWIRHQRLAGWPDMHPEDYCHRCGNRNLSAWHTDSDTWQASGIGQYEITCPQCLAQAIEGETGMSTSWYVRLDIANVVGGRCPAGHHEWSIADGRATCVRCASWRDERWAT